MKVLVDALSASAGGGWTYLVNLLRELDRDSRGIDFTILVQADRVPDLTSRCTIVPVGIASAWTRVLFEGVAVPVRARKFDLLYCVADLAPPICSIPTVVALRNLNIYDHRYYDTLRLRLLRSAARLGARRAHRVLFPSSAAARQIGAILDIPSAKTAVVPHGIDLSRFAVDREPEGFLMVPSAVERHKNLEVVVEALRHLPVEIEVRVAGTERTDPAYAKQIRDLAVRRGVSERFQLLGGVPYSEMVELYRRCAAVIVPSWIETFGHPLLEAMAVGAPLVVSDLEVFREVAGPAAWTFSPENPLELAEAVAAALDPDRAREKMRIGRERVGRFSWRASVDTLCEELRRSWKDASPRAMSQ